jgi:5,10-methenyltetrahydrofolate synthetase
MDIIRERLKEKRKNLTKKQSSELSHAIFLRIIRSSWIQEHSNIGIYYAINGEADTLKLIEFLWSNNQNAFLPVMNHNGLLFGNFAPNSDLNKIHMAYQNQSSLKKIKYLPMNLMWSLFLWSPLIKMGID